MAAGPDEEPDLTVIDRFEIDEHNGGVGWFAYPDEPMQRASHALQVDGAVWVIDPVDAPGVDDLLAEFGEVAGVALLLDRHKRDAAAIARRHDVAVHLPTFMRGVADDLDAETVTYRRELGDTGYGAHEVVNNRFWKEAALYGEDTGVLVVADALGTNDFILARGERLGISPVLRLRPPRKLARLAPERILVGHGEGIHEEAAEALQEAFRGTRRRAPRLFLSNLKYFLPF